MKPVVAHYNSSYLPITEVWLYHQVKHLDGFYTPFLCRTTQNLSQFPIDLVLALNDLPLVSRIYNLLYFKIVGYIPRFASQVKEAKLLHVHFGYNAIKMTGLKRHLGIPMICSFYGTDAFFFPLKKSRNHRRLMRMLKRVDKVLVLGPYMRDSLVELGCPASKIAIHHLGVDLSRIKYQVRKYDSSRPIRFLMTSSFVEKKGVDICLKALSNLKDQIDFVVDVIGDGPLKPAIIKILEEGGIKERVILHGYQPYDFFINLAYQSDVFLQASKTSRTNDKEGTPMSLVDAMATGLPVVATRHSDIPEIVQHGTTGFLAKENSVDDFEKAILNMANHIHELSTYSELSRQWIEKEFDAKKQSELLSDLYMEMMNESL